MHAPGSPACTGACRGGIARQPETARLAASADPRLAARIVLAEYEHLPHDVEAGRLVHGQCGDVEVAWAYERLKPALRMALEQVPSLYSFTGD